MSSLVAARLGVQTPRVQCLPVGAVTSAGVEVVELAESAGLTLDPWQRHVIHHGLAERADGQWAAFEVGLVVPRQNGKGSILEALELAGLFLFGERLILHSAHEFKTAAEAFLRVKALIDNTDDLRRKVARVRTAHGDEGIELRDGARLRFVARSRGSGRGFSADRIILDEAYNLDAGAMAALLPTLSSIPNPQVWYTSSAPMLTSSQLLAVRRRALSGDVGRLAFFEWSIDPNADDPASPEAWAKANPALGIRISEEFVAAEFDAMREHAAAFARERLGVPDDPSDSAGRLPLSVWRTAADPGSTIEGDPLSLAWDVNPERSWASFAVAGRRADGRWHVEVVDRRQGVDWSVDRAVELYGRYRLPVRLDPRQAGALAAALGRAGVPVVEVSTSDMARACAGLVDAVGAGTLAHLSQEPLDLAVAGASDRPLGDAWAWSRKNSSVDIAPLVAVTVALDGAVVGAPPADPLQAVW